MFIKIGLFLLGFSATTLVIEFFVWLWSLHPSVASYNEKINITCLALILSGILFIVADSMDSE